MALTVSTLNQFSQISEINSDKATWNFKAKIIRLWQVSDFNRNTLPFSIEMVLMNNDGGRIHATIKKTLIYKFKNDLIEGKVYCFENLGVSTNGGAYRTTHHPYKMNFQYTSVVQRCYGCVDWFWPRARDHKLKWNDDQTECDYLGAKWIIVKTPLNMLVIYSPNLNQSLLLCDLYNRHKIQCTLFGPYVDELNAFLGAGDCNNATVIMQLAKTKSFQDKIHIQNCLNCSVLIFNSTCAESVALRSSFAESVETPSPMTLTQINLESRVEPIDDFLYNTPRITLQSLSDARTGSLHVVAATVKRILNPDSFWYTACVCGKGVILDSRMFYCEKCNKHVSKVVPRFCIKVRVMDHTDSATFVIFDNNAATLFDMSCADMIHEMEIAGGVGAMPPQLHSLIDNTWLFKVEAKANQNQMFEQSFRTNFFQDEAILAPTLDVVEQVNDCVLSMVPGESTEYLSCDTPCKSDEDHEVQDQWFTSEFLNDIKCSGIPNHRLTLKVGVPVMLMRNIDQASGLCNDTRLQILDLGKNVIKASIITGKNAGENVHIPRMDLVPSDYGLPFKFERRQFPICLCFAMTINKSQGQSLSKVDWSTSARNMIETYITAEWFQFLHDFNIQVGTRLRMTVSNPPETLTILMIEH
ncbi:hypothetical protein TSUD_73290 [Trifolium subterraneum]|uniref:Uncharacterized protein n=1 Tax=Trifolium subterraneum TaxID=3900 RepID=A0A2Z6LV90_TRISU|nr:hypothetical protein TSUD_73290 [Trifolium subterraneum]